MKYHAGHEALKNHKIKLVHYCYDFQVVDILTKALLGIIFERLKGLLGLSIKNLKKD